MNTGVIQDTGAKFHKEKQGFVLCFVAGDLLGMRQSHLHSVLAEF